MNFVTKSFQASLTLGVLGFGAMLLSALPSMARPASLYTNTNLRSGASLNAPVLEVLKSGGKVEVLNIARGADGYTWSYVRSEIEGTEEGWVRSDLLNFHGSNRDYGILLGQRGDRINVRADASTQSAIRHYGLSGDVVSVVESTYRYGFNWYLVTFPNGATGWVRGDLIAVGH
jgi:uncharacterized protein YgiM (DUF1202 family)